MFIRLATGHVGQVQRFIISMILLQSRSMISLIPDDRKRELRNYGLTPMASPAAYKYFSRD